MVDIIDISNKHEVNEAKTLLAGFDLKESYMGLTSVYISKIYLQKLLFEDEVEDEDFEENEIKEEDGQPEELDSEGLKAILQNRLGTPEMPKMKQIVQEYTDALDNKEDAKNMAAADTKLKKKSVYIKECDCHREIMARDIHSEEENVFDTCSDHSRMRGPGQNVIAYSYYGSFSNPKHWQRLYFSGIWHNFMSMKSLYPGWTMRIYHNLDSHDVRLQSICFLACKNPEVDICNVADLPNFGNAANLTPMVWRFLTILDSQVTNFMSRDLDSVLIERERDAVMQWLNSTKAFHVMRDHPHHNYPVMGGLWGLKLKAKEQKAVLESFLLASRFASWHVPSAVASSTLWRSDRQMNEEYFDDQDFLMTFFWPWAHHNMMSHDAYLCQEFKNTIPFPTQREKGLRNLVGALPNLSQEKTCPEQCRKEPDWTYC